MKTISIVITILLLFGCRSPEKIAARRAAKEAADRKKEMVQLQKVREALPCAPVQPLKQGITQYLPGERIPCNGKDSAKCPDQKVRVDTLQVEDQAALKAVRDSLDQMEYMWDQMREQYTDEAKRNDKLQVELKEAKEEKGAWQKRALYTWAGLGLLVAGGIFSKIKGII